jgi:hypothetical protein
MEPWLVSGDDYRGVRDFCNVSAALVKRQLPNWTPSMPMVALDGVTLLPSVLPLTQVR